MLSYLQRLKDAAPALIGVDCFRHGVAGFHASTSLACWFSSCLNTPLLSQLQLLAFNHLLAMREFMCYYKLLSFNFFFCPVFLLYFGLPETGTGIGSAIVSFFSFQLDCLRMPLLCHYCCETSNLNWHGGAGHKLQIIGLHEQNVSEMIQCPCIMESFAPSLTNACQ